MNKKFKQYYVGFIILLIMLSVFQVSVHEVNGAPEDTIGDNAYWKRLAENAWQYFQPGVGVNSKTGLHYASVGFHCFTSWDLAVYLNAILDAQALGLISVSGDWGADYRLTKVLDWLQTIQLTDNNQPYLWYDADTGRPAFSVSRDGNNIYDYGSFLVALHRVAVSKPYFADTINYIVNTRLNTSSLVPQFGHYRDYTYYAAHGFHYFGYNSTKITNELNLLSTWESLPKNTVYGIEFPKSQLMCEPLLLAVFAFDSELDSKSKPLLNKLMHNVYLAHEARYNATGKFTAMSEGSTGLLLSHSYIYESTVSPDGEPWVIYPNTYTFTPISITPIAYFKVAISFLALYDTSYARDMVAYLEPRLLTYGGLFTSACGYMEGIDENNRTVESTTDKTNGLILSAAKYALEHNPPDPTSSPVLTTTHTSTVLPTSTGTPDAISRPANGLTETKTLGFLFIAISCCLLLYLTIQTRLRQKRHNKHFLR